MRPPRTWIPLAARAKACVLSAAVGTLVLASVATGAPQRTVQLKIGDAVDVVNTRIACFAVKSGGKDGIDCVLWGKNKPLAGSFSVGLAVDGTAVLSRLKADGSSEQVFKRRLQARGRAAKVYKLGVGDAFGIPVTAKVTLGCKVINVTDSSLDPIYRGPKVSCWRATDNPLPSTYGVSISDKMAGVFAFDSKGAVSSEGIVRRQPR